MTKITEVRLGAKGRIPLILLGPVSGKQEEKILSAAFKSAYSFLSTALLFRRRKKKKTDPSKKSLGLEECALCSLFFTSPKHQCANKTLKYEFC